MTRVTVIYDMDGTHGLGCTQIEAEGIADIFLSGGEHPGRMVSRTVELEAEDAKSTSTDEPEDTLPGRYVRPGFRVVDGDGDGDD
jgi:hypothetical protein